MIGIYALETPTTPYDFVYNRWKRSHYLVYWLLIYKYVLSTIFWYLNLQFRLFFKR